jgi:hypothetical protein
VVEEEEVEGLMFGLVNDKGEGLASSEGEGHQHEVLGILEG